MRSLMHHSFEKEADVLSDANYILANFDQDNLEALIRRAHAYKTQGRYEEAVKDYELCALKVTTQSIRDDLDFCKEKVKA